MTAACSRPCWTRATPARTCSAIAPISRSKPRRSWPRAAFAVASACAARAVVCCPRRHRRRTGRRAASAPASSTCSGRRRPRPVAALARDRDRAGAPQDRLAKPCLQHSPTGDARTDGRRLTGGLRPPRPKTSAKRTRRLSSSRPHQKSGPCSSGAHRGTRNRNRSRWP